MRIVYLIEYLKNHKKVFTNIVYFIRYWCTIGVFAVYGAFYYIYGWTFTTYILAFIFLGFLCSWLGDFTVISVKYFKKRFAKKRGKK